MKSDGGTNKGKSHKGTGPTRGRGGSRAGSKNPAERGAESRDNQAHRQLREAIEGLSEGFALYDAEDRLVVWNSSFVNINFDLRDLIAEGVKFEALLRAAASRGQVAVPKSQQEGWVQERLKYQRQGGQYERHLNDGRWVQVSRRPTKKGGVVVIWADITERKKAEEELRAHKRLLETVFNSLPHHLYVKDRQGRYRMVNEPLAKFFGVETAEILGKPTLEISGRTLEEKRNSFEEDQGILTGETPRINVENVHTTPTGETRYLQVIKNPLRDDSGKITGLVGINLDITETRRAGQELQASEKRFRSLVEGSIQGIVIHRDFNPLFVNQAMATMHGYETPGEIQKKRSIRPLIATHERTRLKKYNSSRLRGETAPKHYEYQGVRKDGSLVWLDATVRKVMWEGEPAVQGTFHDITDRKNAEEALLRAKQEMELTNRELQEEIQERLKADQAKDEFLAIVNHELRTPLTSLQGSLDLLGNMAVGELSPEARELVDVGWRNSERLGRLINDLLDFQKAKNGSLTLNLETLSLSALVKLAVMENQPYGEQFGVTFELEGTCAPAKVIGDKNRVGQILSNLLSNAAKFSPPGSAVIVSVSKRSNLIRVSVRDCGAGIPKEFRPLVFQKFAQANTTGARKHGGLGLGLTIAKDIVEQMGGKIGFKTRTGAGTTFYFDLPEVP